LLLPKVGKSGNHVAYGTLADRQLTVADRLTSTALAILRRRAGQPVVRPSGPAPRTTARRWPLAARCLE